MMMNLLPWALSALILSTNSSAAEVIQSCAPDWQDLDSGCWIETLLFTGKKRRSYVHPRGWIIDGSCLADKRFSSKDLFQAVETAWRKMDPETPLSAGGCLSHFNPDWGRALIDAVAQKRMHILCPEYDSTSSACADHQLRDRYERTQTGNSRRDSNFYHLISLRNVSRCIGPGSSGLTGVLFHETLHGAGADNYSTGKHNKAWSLPQFEFVSDRVYAAEAICFFGFDPRLRGQVNVLQCKRTIEYGVTTPRQELCAGFDATFTDRPPPGFIKH